MRVTFANTFDSRGGAARAALRLFQGMRHRTDVQARMVVQNRSGQTPGVLTPFLPISADTTSFLDQYSLKRTYPDRMRVPFSVNRLSGLAPFTINRTRPELVHLHWLHCGFMRIEQLARLKAPLVWTIHDMWAFTGVCHYSGGCERYMNGCGRCPLLGSAAELDVSRTVFARKSSVYPGLNLTVVSPSNWLADLARKSPLLRDKPVKVIPNGIDTDLFYPIDRVAARSKLGLPVRKRLVLFGADHAMHDRRKGGHMLVDALGALETANVEAVVFGAEKPEGQSPLPLKTHWLGRIDNDWKLAMLYSAADLFVAPSLEENLSNAVMEALSCATPVLAFDIGGMSDMVETGRNGLLVPLDEGPQGLRAALESLISDQQKLDQLRFRARESVLERFRLQDIADRYAELYRQILGTPSH